jgi:hypothetical protein
MSNKLFLFDEGQSKQLAGMGLDMFFWDLTLGAEMWTKTRIPVYFLASSSDEETHEVDFFTPIEEFSSPSSPPEIQVLIW